MLNHCVLDGEYLNINDDNYHAGRKLSMKTEK